MPPRNLLPIPSGSSPCRIRRWQRASVLRRYKAWFWFPVMAFWHLASETTQATDY